MSNGKSIRGLSEKFLVHLSEGKLSGILDRVKKDQTLDMEIRYNYVNIYYRGGNLLRITEHKKAEYEFFFDEKYLTEEYRKRLPELSKRIVYDSESALSLIAEWIENIDLMKNAMDIWFGLHPKEERDFQQKVIYDNNDSSVAGGTDYFVLDIEYDNHEGARFDLIAMEWESKPNIRKLSNNYHPKLTIIEMKYGDSSVTGKSGIVDHLQKHKSFFTDQKEIDNFKVEMVEILSQKRMLGLIPALRDNQHSVNNFDKDIDFILLIANHDPEKSNLFKELQRIVSGDEVNSLPFDIKLSTSVYMGYGLYKEGIYKLSDFLHRYDY